MTTMLDKCAVAGDITQGIDRRGVWTAAITVIGGTSETAVKLVSCDTVDGEYTDFKTLISAADADTDQYKGFVVDLHGAKKYIKVIGAVMATAVFGDCDHDVKDIAITAGEVPSGADLENNHEVTITENGEIKITPSAGKDGMKKVTATVNVPSEAKEEQTKSVTITENGTTTVSPDSGKVLSGVSITTNVSGGGSSGYSFYNVFDVYFSALNDSASASTKVKNGDLIIIRPGNVLAETGGAKTEQSYYPSDIGTAWTVKLGDSFTYSQSPNALTVSVANDGTLTATCSSFGYDRAFTLLICHV